MNGEIHHIEKYASDLNRSIIFWVCFWPRNL